MESHACITHFRSISIGLALCLSTLLINPFAPLHRMPSAELPLFPSLPSRPPPPFPHVLCPCDATTQVTPTSTFTCYRRGRSSLEVPKYEENILHPRSSHRLDDLSR